MLNSKLDQMQKEAATLPFETPLRHTGNQQAEYLDKAEAKHSTADYIQGV